MKLHLDLNDLHVESFNATEVPEPGYYAPTYEERCSRGGLTCEGTCMTCPNTCVGTCNDPSCAVSCTA